MTEERALLDDIEPPPVDTEYERQKLAVPDEPPKYDEPNVATHGADFQRPIPTLPSFPPTNQMPPPPPMSLSQMPAYAPFQQQSSSMATTVVVQQPYIQRSTVAMQSHGINDYYCLSIVTILLFCWPIGLVALSASRRARDHLFRGDLNGAREASTQALQLNVAGIVIGIVILAITIGVFVGIIN